MDNLSRICDNWNVEVTPKEIEHYITDSGDIPFEQWFRSLRSETTKAIILKRLARVETGNLGESNYVGEGVYELKIDFGPGYRIYFGQEGAKLIILLCGGDKNTQQKDIKKAQQYWATWRKQ